MPEDYTQPSREYEGPFGPFTPMFIGGLRCSLANCKMWEAIFEISFAKKV